MSKRRRNPRHGRPRAERRSVQSLREWARALRVMRGGVSYRVAIHDEATDWAAWLQRETDALRPEENDDGQ